jgi:hypothetical protein
MYCNAFENTFSNDKIYLCFDKKTLGNQTCKNTTALNCFMWIQNMMVNTNIPVFVKLKKFENKANII